MKQSGQYSLQRTMIIYFLLIGFASSMVGLEFVAETHSGDLTKELTVNFQKHSKGLIDLDEAFVPIDRLRSKAVLMLVVILLVMVILLTMFIKNITEPLQHMIESSREISAGDLSKTITIQSKNELYQLGSVINEMSSNLQEIIMLSRSVCSSVAETTDRNLELLSRKNMSEKDVGLLIDENHRLQSELDLLTDVIECFDFYSVEKSNGA